MLGTSPNKQSELPETLEPSGDATIDTTRTTTRQKIMSAYGDAWGAVTTVAGVGAEVAGATVVYAGETAVKTTVKAVQGIASAVSKVMKRSNAA